MAIKVKSQVLEDLIDPGAEVERVATGFTFTRARSGTSRRSYCCSAICPGACVGGGASPMACRRLRDRATSATAWCKTRKGTSWCASMSRPPCDSIHQGVFSASALGVWRCLPRGRLRPV